MPTVTEETLKLVFERAGKLARIAIKRAIASLRNQISFEEEIALIHAYLDASDQDYHDKE